MPPATSRVDSRGEPIDWWRRPLHYWTDGTHYRVTSYGRDGRPGGVGLDYDLSSDDLESGRTSTHAWPRIPKQATPTFRQFLSDRGDERYPGSGRMMALMCALAGLVAFVFGFVTLGAAVQTRQGVRGTLRRLVITIVGTVFLAMIITTLHVPTGH